MTRHVAAAAIRIHRPNRLAGVLRKVVISVDGGPDHKVSLNDSVELRVGLGYVKVLARSGFSKASWEGEVSEDVDLEVGFRGISDSFAARSEIYLTKVAGD